MVLNKDNYAMLYISKAVLILIWLEYGIELGESANFTYNDFKS